MTDLCSASSSGEMHTCLLGDMWRNRSLVMTLCVLWQLSPWVQSQCSEGGSRPYDYPIRALLLSSEVKFVLGGPMISCRTHCHPVNWLGCFASIRKWDNISEYSLWLIILYKRMACPQTQFSYWENLSSSEPSLIRSRLFPMTPTT